MRLRTSVPALALMALSLLAGMMLTSFNPPSSAGEEGKEAPSTPSCQA